MMLRMSVARAPVAAGTVEVWWSPIDLSPSQLDTLRATLDAETRDRIAALVRPDDRLRALVAHGILRRRAAAALDVPAADLRLRRSCPACGATDHGKPEVDVAGAPAISLSHAGRFAVVGLSVDGPIGVDVEDARPAVDWERARRHVFSDAEWDATAHAPDPAAARLAAWSRKEAASKVTGHGVALGLERVIVAPGADAGGWRTADLPDGLGAVRVADVALEGAVAAVAVPAGGTSVDRTVRRAEV